MVTLFCFVCHVYVPVCLSLVFSANHHYKRNDHHFCGSCPFLHQCLKCCLCVSVCLFGFGNVFEPVSKGGAVQFLTEDVSLTLKIERRSVAHFHGFDGIDKDTLVRDPANAHQLQILCLQVGHKLHVRPAISHQDRLIHGQADRSQPLGNILPTHGLGQCDVGTPVSQEIVRNLNANEEDTRTIRVALCQYHTTIRLMVQLFFYWYFTQRSSLLQEQWQGTRRGMQGGEKTIPNE